MFSHYFEQINNIELFPVISLLLFFTLFIFLVIRVIYLKKDYLNRMRELPLDLNKNEENYEK
jgi:hypothetical protein